VDDLDVFVNTKYEINISCAKPLNCCFFSSIFSILKRKDMPKQHILGEINEK
jgi:hypothetical protein